MTMLATRPGRKMPSMKRICAYWGIPEDICVRCESQGPCERAHIIDRSANGLDHEGNLLPLCSWCHAQQPSSDPEDWPTALAWFLEPPVVPWDFGYEADPARLHRMARWALNIIKWTGGCQLCWAADHPEYPRRPCVRHRSVRPPS